MYPQLLLITQLHRSGGTLFSQLLDGHSGIQAHPHELFIGKPQKWNWPKLAKLLNSPELLFESLQEDKIAAIGRQGVFIKPGSNLEAGKQDVSFTYSLTEHRQRFVELYSQAPVKTQRFAIQIYFHTFFASWPEHHSSGHERYISCFLPHLILHSDSLRRLFADFPDVMLVSLLRRPDSWIASLVNHISLSLADTETVQKHLERWRFSVKPSWRCIGIQPPIASPPPTKHSYLIPEQSFNASAPWLAFPLNPSCSLQRSADVPCCPIPVTAALNTE